MGFTERLMDKPMRLAGRVLRSAYFAGFVLLAFSHVARAQERDGLGLFEVRLYAGAETHTLGDVRELGTDIAGELRQDGIPVEVVDAFAPRLALGLDAVLLRHDGDRLGLYLGFASTGSRLHYEDYSGEIAVDLLLTRVAAGVSVERSVVGSPFVALARVGYAYTRFRDETRVRLYDEATEVEGPALVGHNLTIMPAVAYDRTLSNRFFLRASLGYEVVTPFWRLRYDGEPTTIRADWSGVRLGVAVGFRP